MITIIFLLVSLRLIAPVDDREIILYSGPQYIYNVKDPFLRSVIRYESNFNERAVNPYSKARGVLQILPVMICEVNKYSDVKYTWNDAWDPVKSIEIWWIIMNKKNPEYFPDKACRIWFGTGIQKHDGMTWEDYYNEVMLNL